MPSATKRVAARVAELRHERGMTQETLAAKRRALPHFLSFSQDLYGHDRPEEWPPFPLIARRSG